MAVSIILVDFISIVIALTCIMFYMSTEILQLIFCRSILNKSFIYLSVVQEGTDNSLILECLKTESKNNLVSGKYVEQQRFATLTIGGL